MSAGTCTGGAGQESGGIGICTYCNHKAELSWLSSTGGLAQPASYPPVVELAAGSNFPAQTWHMLKPPSLQLAKQSNIDTQIKDAR